MPRLCWDGVIGELAGVIPRHRPRSRRLGRHRQGLLLRPVSLRLPPRALAAICQVLGLDEPVFFAGSSFGAELVARGTAERRWGWNVRAAVSITGTGGRLYRVPGGIERLSDYTPSLDAAARLTAMLVNSAEGMEDHFPASLRQQHDPGPLGGSERARPAEPLGGTSGPTGGLARAAAALRHPDPVGGGGRRSAAGAGMGRQDGRAGRLVLVDGRRWRPRAQPRAPRRDRPAAPDYFARH